MPASAVPTDLEVAHNAWRNNPRTASYYWAIERDGDVIASEINLATFALTKIVDGFPGRPRAQVADDGSVLHRWEATEAHEAYVLAAIPHTLDHQNLPEIRYEIEPGMTPIWSHRVGFGHGYDGKQGEGDVLVIGRKLADGTEDVTTVHPDGKSFAHDSLEAAVAHVDSVHLAGGLAEIPEADDDHGDGA